jgi:hypothetical protein
VADPPGPDVPDAEVPGPERPAAAPVAPAEAIDIDDVILAWGEILPSLPVATRSAAAAAQPLRIERRIDGDVLVFGAPPADLAAAGLRFKKEADTIRAALASRLGRSLKFILEPAPEFSLGGRPPAPTSATDEPGNGDPGAHEEPPPEPEDLDIDLSEAVDAGPAGESAGVGLLREQLGATVVEELPRDTGS